MSKNNTQNLRRFNKKLSAMSTEVAGKIAARAAGEITTLARAAYDGGVSVYGEAYPNGYDLVDKGTTKANVRFTCDGGTKIRCVINTRQAKYLIRYGILPNSSAALPAAWSARLKEITNEEMGKVVS